MEGNLEDCINVGALEVHRMDTLGSPCEIERRSGKDVLWAAEKGISSSIWSALSLLPAPISHDSRPFMLSAVYSDT